MAITNRVEATLPEYAPPMPAYRVALLRALLKRLDRIPGPKGMQPEAKYQAENDPDLTWITKSGKVYKRVERKYLGSDAQCHWNVGKLYKLGYVDTICIGYAQNDEGWHQHTWGLLNDGVVETTPSNFHNSAWFGVALSEEQADGFTKFMKRAKPGMGFVRTWKGGAVQRMGE